MNELIVKAQKGDKAAMNKLVADNLNLVNWVIHRMHLTKHPDREDLVQEGNIGLFRAINTFDVEAGTKLSTYAVQVIKRAIIKYLTDNEEEDSTVDLEMVDEEGDTSMIDGIKDPSVNIEKEVCAKITSDSFEEILVEAIGRVASKTKNPKQTKEIFFYTYGLLGHSKMKIKDIAAKLGISAQAVSLTIKRSGIGKIDNGKGLTKREGIDPTTGKAVKSRLIVVLEEMGYSPEKLFEMVA